MATHDPLVRRPARHGSIAAVLAALLAVVGLTAVAAPAAARPALRASRTEHRVDAVGRQDVTFVDTSRPTPSNGTYPGAPSRTLPTMILYPATGPASTTAITTGAPPARRGAPFPLVVFSHGFTANGPAYAPFLRQIVARGYVIAAPTFPLSSAGAPGGPKLLDYLNQPGDVSFVITRMLALTRKPGPLRGLVDRHRVAAAGHSLGAITTIGVAFNGCCADHRLKAAVPMSGLELPFGQPFTFPRVPLLLVHGNADQTVPYSGSTKVFSDAKLPKFLLTLLGAPHTFMFGPPYGPVTVNVTVDFFDRYLKGKDGALARMGRDANVAGVAHLDSVVPRGDDKVG